MPAYDAFLLVSFGGPEGPDDVMPFLRNVTRGRAVPEERLADVAEHYYAFGGVSPINQQCRDLLTTVRADFAASGLALPVYWGNRNWSPYLADTVRAMAADGVRRAAAFVTSAYSSYSSCRQYLDDIERARAAAGADAPVIDKLRRFFNHPGFIEPFAEHARAALATLPGDVREDAHLVFTAHSIPVAMAEASGPQWRAEVRSRADRGVPPDCRTPRWYPPVDARLPEQERAAVTAVARARRARPPRRAGEVGDPRRGGHPGRVRVGPHGGPARPGP